MKWKYVPPILIIAVPYLIIIPILFTLLNVSLLPDSFAAHYIPVALFVGFPTAVLWNLLCVCSGKWDTDVLARWNLRIKLFLIPVYLFVFIFSIGVPLAIPVLFLFDILLLLSSSCYGFRALIRIRKDERIGNEMFFVLFLCHCCFVVDVIAALVLHRKLKS